MRFGCGHALTLQAISELPYDATRADAYSVVIHCRSWPMSRLTLICLKDEDPFEIDAQAAHLFKHPYLGIQDIADV